MILLLLACRGPLPWIAEPCAAEFVEDTVDPGVRSMRTQLDDPAGDGVIAVQLRWPDRAPRADERWPIAVVLHGGWNQQGTPVEPNSGRVDPDEGVVDIHLDLPGNGLSGGVNDRRGAGSRAAVAAALRWAAGTTRDIGACTAAERSRGGDPDRVFLVGTSNGGNLAAATLADPTLDLPEVDGLVLWETPAGAQFANVELGSEPTVYEPGTCALTDEGAIRCAYPTDRLAWTTAGDRPATFCFDLDADAACGDTDVTIHSTEDPLLDLRYLSPWLTADLDTLGAPLDGYADVDTTTRWWAERDAAQAAAALVAARPALPVLLVASETDHIQNLPDHPHVFGVGEALQRAGAAWTRLNPGDRWLRGGPENPPDAPMRLADPDLGLLEEDTENPLPDALAAAVWELDDRISEGDWTSE